MTKTLESGEDTWALTRSIARVRPRFPGPHGHRASSMESVIDLEDIATCGKELLFE